MSRARGKAIPPTEVWTPRNDGTYSTEYWFPADSYTAKKPPTLTGVVTSSATAEPGADNWSDLFNGRDLTGWNLHNSDGKQPPIPWTADSDRKVLVANSGGHNWLESEGQYRDFVLSFEWRFPPGKFVSPNGSGVVVRADGLNSINYDPKGIEIDLLRSTSDDKTRGPGTFVTYDTSIEHSRGATPDRGNGMKGTTTEPQAFAVTNWNTCEIACQRDRISVTINSVLVNEATGVPERAGKICLRNQNCDVEFRNIRIRELSPEAPSSTDDNTGWTDLFNGRDLTGWLISSVSGNPPPNSWMGDATRQVLIAKAVGHSWVETTENYQDFTLKLEWRFTPGGSVGVNGSGIVVRTVKDTATKEPQAIEIDLIEKSDPAKPRETGGIDAINTPLQHRGGTTPAHDTVNISPIAKAEVFNDGRWNACEIKCQGDRIRVTMNGVMVNEVWSVPERAGKILLRNQNTDVEFRNVRIRNLDANARGK